MAYSVEPKRGTEKIERLAQIVRALAPPAASPSPG
jgi:hypothetical protein